MMNDQIERPGAQAEEALTGEQQLEKILSAYVGYYDITRDVPVGDLVFPALAEFHSRSEKYVLVKKAKLWAMEENEYVYFLLTDTLDIDAASHTIDLIREDGLGRITPHSEHMCSNVSMAVIANNVTPEAERLIGRYRFHKDFRLALHGWMEFRIAVLNRSNGKILKNPAGRDVRDTLERYLTPNKKERRKNK